MKKDRDIGVGNLAMAGNAYSIKANLTWFNFYNFTFKQNDCCYVDFWALNEEGKIIGD